MAVVEKSVAAQGKVTVTDLMSRVERIRRTLPKLSRYTLVSVAALGLDFTVYLALLDAVGFPTFAGVAGYTAGLLLHYNLSVRYVFDAAATQKSMRRTFAEFAASGLVGLGVTASVIWVTTSYLGVPAIAAKGLAVVVSFLAVFMMRHAIVFAPAR
jgi:putative flippase GtrA